MIQIFFSADISGKDKKVADLDNKSCGALCCHIKTKGILPLTAGSNKSVQQLKRWTFSILFPLEISAWC